MFRYFPTNYVWNLSVDLAIEMGARIGEIEEMCAPLQEAARQPDAAGTAAFRETWSKMGDKLCALAEDDEARGRLISAGDKYGRAATYYLTAERLQAHDAPGRLELYKRMRSVFDRGVRLPMRTASGSRSPTAKRICPRCIAAPKASRDPRRTSSSSTGSIRRRR